MLALSMKLPERRTSNVAGQRLWFAVDSMANVAKHRGNGHGEEGVELSTPILPQANFRNEIRVHSTSFHLRNFKMEVILVAGSEPAPRRVGMEDGASFADARLCFRAVVTRLSGQVLIDVCKEAARAQRAEHEVGQVQGISRQAIACPSSGTRPSAGFVSADG